MGSVQSFTESLRDKMKINVQFSVGSDQRLCLSGYRGEVKVQDAFYRFHFLNVHKAKLEQETNTGSAGRKMGGRWCNSEKVPLHYLLLTLVKTSYNQV